MDIVGERIEDEYEVLGCLEVREVGGISKVV